jgi:hypothetical protein
MIFNYGTSTDALGKKVLKFYNREYDRSADLPFTYLAWTENDKVQAVILFDNWNVGSIQAHLRSINGLTREMIIETYRYVFIQCRCEILIAQTPSWNYKTIRMLIRGGFTPWTRIPKFYGPRDDDTCHMLIITKEFLKKKWIKNGKRT